VNKASADGRCTLDAITEQARGRNRAVLNDLRSVDVTKIRTALQELTAAVRGQLEADETNAK
jgi:hypothetical protein